MSALLWLALVASAALIGFGAVRFASAIRAYRQRQDDARYRAASLVLTETRKLRAGQLRAAAREWGRAA